MMMSGDNPIGSLPNPWDSTPSRRRSSSSRSAATTNMPVPGSGKPTMRKPLNSPWPARMNVYQVPGQTMNTKPGYKRMSGYGGGTSSARISRGR